ncbi:MAG: glutamate racemase [Bacteroidota bacterium]|jgi:glutamate racemase
MTKGQSNHSVKESRNAPIGIFDSGIGGLTVAHAIHSLMPSESIVYFGDTAHMPYGEKSPEAIRGYAQKITDFLLLSGCKAVVIACNSASSVAYDTVKKHAGNKIVVMDVINPVVQKIASLKKIHEVGVIGTRATIRSNAYAQGIHSRNPNLKVSSLATPLLAPMIEEGFFNNNISRTIINSYLSRPKLKKIDVLILACTHYPLIRKEIGEYYHRDILIVDSAEIVAKQLKETLRLRKLLSTRKKAGSHRFFVSDLTASFEKSTKIFFKGKVRLELQNLWR